MKIENRKMKDLKQFEANPRENDHAVKKAATAIKEFGFRVPILIKNDGLIIDGHLRYKAAIVAGLTEVPCIIADDMTEDQVAAFRISVNKMAELAEWDEKLLNDQLVLLNDHGFDLSLTGFSQEDIFTDKPKKETLRKVDLKAPKMSWVLIGIPLINYGTIQQQIEDLSLQPDIIIQTTCTD